jgi:hypothetical protein
MTTTMPQHMAALERANQVRIAGARFRREVHSLGCDEGKALLAAYLEKGEVPQEIDRMKVERFISSIRRVGDDGVKQVRRMAGIYRTTVQGRPLQVRDLTPRERVSLAAALRSYGR